MDATETTKTEGTEMNLYQQRLESAQNLMRLANEYFAAGKTTVEMVEKSRAHLARCEADALRPCPTSDLLAFAGRTRESKS